MDISRFEARLVRNPRADRARPYGDRERRVLSLAAHRVARQEIAAWPGYAPTPLRRLPGLARRLGLGTLLYKDEAGRFGLGSFKALGGAYAVLGALQERIPGATAAGLAAGQHGAAARAVTVTAATDGNHGRSVAWGARLFGCRCVIYLHEGVSVAREQGIARFGAEIRRVPGGYDASVRRCAEDAAQEGWTPVPDTAAAPDAPVPARVMQGYTLLVQEVLDALLPAAAERPTHCFVQAGVGGLAAAVAGHLWETLGPARPRIIVVEPERADCVFRSVAAGRPTPVPGSADTFMACLAAGEVSGPAWVILEHAADDVLALPDEAAPAAMRLLAKGADGDPPIVSGESGCAATAGLVAAAQDSAIRAALGLDPGSRALVIGSEGATDAEIYARVVGRPEAGLIPVGA